MIKVRMSLLTMSLLAMTLAATISHAARLDASVDTKVNSDPGKLNEKIPETISVPIYECEEKCLKCTVCTLLLPWWANTCLCIPKKLAADASLDTKVNLPNLNSAPGKLNEKIPETISVPIYECEKKCVKCIACTLKLPWWSNTCVCIPKGVPKKLIAAVAVAVQQAPTVEPEFFPYAECGEKCKEETKELYNKLDLLKGPVEKRTGGERCIPYLECVAKCHHKCIPCTKMLPVEANSHICLDLSDSAISKKPALQNSGGDDKQIVLWAKAKMETLPYKECIATCELCACTLIYPPELAICICLTPKPQAAGGKAQPM